MKINLNNNELWVEKGFLGGEWVAKGSNGCFDVTNPSTGSVIATLPRMGTREAQSAIDSAKMVQPAWRRTTAKERSGILRKWFELITENTEDLAKIMTYEQGKPLVEARGEIGMAAACVEWFAEEAKRVHGEVLISARPEQRHFTMLEPVGVGAGITPWNFPSAMVTRKGAAALAAGCTFILKPAEDTPVSALALAYLAEKAGLPRGVLSVIVGNREDAEEIGDVLSLSSDVRKISFTGSTAVGKKLLKKSAATVKKISLELGGCAPVIVFEDADLETTVEGIMSSKFRNAGQTCVCANRILVQRNVYDKFLGALEAATTALKVGDGFGDGVTIGPLINERGLQKVDEQVQDAKHKGATSIVGGAPASDIGVNFYNPTLLGNVDTSMRIMSEETFGPVLPLMPFDSEEEAIKIANDTPTGLAGYFYTQDVNRVITVAEALEYGIVVANAGVFSAEHVPFGGVKEAGLGREGGHQGIEEWCETKFFCIGAVK